MVATANTKRKRKTKIFKSLIVSDGDFKTTLMRDYIEFQNCHDYERLKDFLHKHFSPQFIFKYQFTNSRSPKLIPKRVEFRGINNFMTFIEALNSSAPDMVMILDEVNIRNCWKRGSKNTTIHGQISFSGTAVFAILLIKEHPLKESVRRKILFSEDSINLPKVTNLTKECNTNDSIDLMNELDSSFTFSRGNKIEKYIMEGTMRTAIHMLETNEIYMLEVKVQLEDE